MVHAVVDLSEVESYRASVSSIQEQAASVQRLHQVDVPFKLCSSDVTLMHAQISLPMDAYRCRTCIFTSISVLELYHFTSVPGDGKWIARRC